MRKSFAEFLEIFFVFVKGYEKQGGHARRIMDSYEKWFAEKNQAELDVLYLLGLFDRPAVKEATDALKRQPAIAGLTNRLQNVTKHDWQKTLNHLRELRLIAEKDEHNPDTLDCHPLIRQHFGEKLLQQNAQGFKQAHARLYEYYKKLPEKEFPDKLEEMEPLFAAVMHGCLAGKHQEAMNDVYWKRIKRGNAHYSTAKLGAFGADLSCLSSFFETLWNKPASGLPEGVKGSILSWAGFRLRAVGRLSEAIHPMKASLKLEEQRRYFRGAAVVSSNLSELYLTLGDVSSAQEYGAKSVSLADRSGDGFEMESDRATHANALHQAGKNKAAQNLFVEAESMGKKRDPECPYLYSLRGFLFCDYLLSMGEYLAALERANCAIKIKTTTPLADFGYNNLSIGRAYMLQSVESNSSDLCEAEDYLSQAVNGLREAADQPRLPWGLFARATLYRHQRDFGKSWSDLDEAREIAEYGSMKLHLADYHLEAGRVIREQLSVASSQSSVEEFQIIENGETLSLTKDQMQGRFQGHFEAAERLVEETGYHRRDGEVEELRKCKL